MHWRRTHSLDEELEFSKVGLVSTISSGVGTTVSVILDNNCMALTPIFDEVRPAYLYYFMQTVDLSPFAVATAVPSVMRGDVGSLQIFKPTHEEQDEIIRRIETAFCLARQCCHPARLAPTTFCPNSTSALIGNCALSGHSYFQRIERQAA